MRNNKGFIIIISLGVLTIFVAVAVVIVSIGCSELIAARTRNDLLVSAYYAAISGAEILYSDMKTRNTLNWSSPPTASGSLTVGSVTIGTYSAVARQISSEEFCIVSTGTVNNRTASAIVKYGYLSTYNGPVPLASRGAMNLTGASQQAKLIIEGPAMSNVTVTTNGDYVDIANGTQDAANLPEVNFWLDSYGVDTDSSGSVELSEAVAQGKETEFAVADANSDDIVTCQEAFVYYYTTYLNNPANNTLGTSLNIGTGDTYYYSGDQTFDQGDIPNNVPIIFVDGNVTINYNDQNWQGSGTLNHTIVTTGTMTIYQPTNRPGDLLTLVAYGNVTNSGSMGDKGSTIGDIVIYTHGNYTATDGGKSNASIFANGTLTIDTIGDNQGKDHRVIYKVTEQWTTSEDEPLGLPPGYPGKISFGFSVKNESSYPPVWQRD